MIGSFSENRTGKPSIIMKGSDWPGLHINLVIVEPRCEKTGLRGFPTRSDTNQAIQPQKMARSLKFWIKKGKGLYYPCSETKGADQLPVYRQADLCLCFRICKKPVFSRRGSILVFWFNFLQSHDFLSHSY